MKINTRVYVSVLSKSRLAGEVGTVRGVSARGEVMVENDFGVIGYPSLRHVSENKADAPQFKAVPRDPSKPHSDFVVDQDVAHMYLTQIRPLDVGTRLTQEQTSAYLNTLASMGVSEPDPTDLLTRAVVFQDFFTGATIGGFVSDQWIEDNVELLNIVHEGSFSVVPRSAVICTMKHVPEIGPKAYTVDSHI